MQLRFPLGLVLPFLLFDLRLAPQSTSPEPPHTHSAAPQQDRPRFRPEDHPFHDHAANQPLPKTLDPRKFEDDPQSYVAYSIAAKIRELLYQQPCICPCGKERGHKSLLDCFTGLHGRNCDECKQQVFFCYERNKKGWSAEKIRQAMFRFQFTDIDFKKYAREQWQAMTEKASAGKE